MPGKEHNTDGNQYQVENIVIPFSFARNIIQSCLSWTCQSLSCGKQDSFFYMKRTVKYIMQYKMFQGDAVCIGLLPAARTEVSGNWSVAVKAGSRGHL